MVAQPPVRLPARNLLQQAPPLAVPTILDYEWQSDGSQ
jgi:hypothetical protein